MKKSRTRIASFRKTAAHDCKSISVRPEPEVYAKLLEAAKANRRSITSETELRIEQSFKK